MYREAQRNHGQRGIARGILFIPFSCFFLCFPVLRLRRYIPENFTAGIALLRGTAWRSPTWRVSTAINSHKLTVRDPLEFLARPTFSPPPPELLEILVTSVNEHAGAAPRRVSAARRKWRPRARRCREVERMAGLYSAVPRGLASSCLADRHQNFYDPHVISWGRPGGGGISGP